MDKFSVEYYIRYDGSCPTQEFMDSLDRKMRAKLLRLQLLLEQNGNSLLYFFVVGQKIIITNGFIKKTQKTPKRELQLAKKYRAEYIKEAGDKHE